MTELRFEGKVELYEGGLLDVGPRIGGRDVIAEIEQKWGDGFRKSATVRVTLGVEPVAEGQLWALHGFGGTEVTPADPPEIKVGSVDLMNRLYSLDERHVILIIEDAK